MFQLFIFNKIHFLIMFENDPKRQEKQKF